MFVCVCVGGSVSDIWEEEKEMRAKLITVWATFSDARYRSLSHTHTQTHTQTHLFQVLSLSHMVFFALAQSAEIKVLRQPLLCLHVKWIWCQGANMR